MDIIMRKRFERFLLGLLSSRMAKQAIKLELAPKLQITECVPLTKLECNEVDDLWNCIGTKNDYRSWAFYKTHVGFNPAFVPDSLYVKYILRVLNPMRFVYCLQNKNMYPLLFADLPKPQTVMNCINGVVLGENKTFDYKYSECSNILQEGVKQVIIKPSADSCSGDGVQLLDLDSLNELELAAKFRAMGKSYICQSVVHQSTKTSQFNKSSLNTFRINTLFLHGKVSVVNIMFRHGREGAIVDNGGAGGICCGLDAEGQFTGLAFDSKLNRFEKTAFGEVYSQVKIAEVGNLVELALWSHKKYLPMMGHAAWDFALDENNKPVFIEVNLGWPGILLEQLCNNSPIYGNRTEEVIEYVISHIDRLEWTDFVGHWT